MTDDWVRGPDRKTTIYLNLWGADGDLRSAPIELFSMPID